MTKRSFQKGFVMLEVLVATSLFAIVGTAMVVALNQVADLTFQLNRSQQLSRILDTELRRAMTMPELQEGKETKVLDELGVEIETVVERLEGLENQEGRALNEMFLVRVAAFWWQDGEYQNQTTESWRYARLYR